MDMLNNSETLFKNVFIIFMNRILHKLINLKIIDRPLAFHRKHPNKIEIKAIRSLAGLK
jgi:hypothetical protein